MADWPPVGCALADNSDRLAPSLAPFPFPSHCPPFPFPSPPPSPLSTSSSTRAVTSLGCPMATQTSTTPTARAHLGRSGSVGGTDPPPPPTAWAHRNHRAGWLWCHSPPGLKLYYAHAAVMPAAGFDGTPRIYVCRVVVLRHQPVRYFFSLPQVAPSSGQCQWASGCHI